MIRVRACRAGIASAAMCAWMLGCAGCAPHPAPNPLEHAQSVLDPAAADIAATVNEESGSPAPPPLVEGQVTIERVESGGRRSCSDFELRDSEVNAPAGSKYTGPSTSVSPFPAHALDTVEATFRRAATEHGFAQITDDSGSSPLFTARDSDSNMIRLMLAPTSTGELSGVVSGESPCIADQ